MLSAISTMNVAFNQKIAFEDISPSLTILAFLIKTLLPIVTIC
jgi:hypothetical protein